MIFFNEEEMVLLKICLEVESLLFFSGAGTGAGTGTGADKKNRSR